MSAPSDHFSKVLSTHRPQLLAFIQRSLGPALRAKVEPDDIAQEVMVSALGAPESFAVEGRDPFKLLCQLAEQRIIDAHRRHFTAQKRSAARERSLNSSASADSDAALASLLVASITSPSAAFSRRQRELRLQQALKDLSDEQRTVLRLRYVDGLPTKEIAEQLGRSDGAIRVLLSRTVGQLQTLLADEASDAGTR